MKIALISLHYNPISGAGLHQILKMFLEFFSKRGHKITLFTAFSDSNILPKDTSYKIIEKHLEGSFLTTQKNIANLLLAEEKNFDLYFICGPALLWGGGIYKKQGGKNPTVVFINNYTSGMWKISLKKQKSKIVHNIKKYIWEKTFGLIYAKYLDAQIYDSPEIQSIYEKFGYKKNKSKLLLEPIEIQTETQNFDKNKGEFKILFAGRLIKEKGVDILLKAMIQLKKLKKIHLDIVGDGPEKQTVLDFIKNNNLSNIITLHPWQSKEKLIEFYKNSDVFVHPCRWIEPFGRTVVEAMSFGIPIITTEKTGASWAMNKGGITFKNGNVNDLSLKISTLYNDYEFKKELSKKAFERSKEFDSEKTLPVLEQFFQNIVNGKNPENLKIF